MADTFSRAMRRIVGVVVVAGACQGHATEARIFEGYDAFYQSFPGALFTARDEKPMDDPQSFEGQAFRAWGALAADGEPRAPDAHRVEILGLDMTIDGRPFPAATASVFLHAVATEVGSDARLFVNAHDVCVQGVAPSSSGTAQRHVHVRLVTDAFTNRARRYDLPALFNSCLALYQGPRASVHFFEAVYHTPKGAQLADGVVFRRWTLKDGRFTPRGGAVRVWFPDPGNVYRFSVVDR